MSGSRRVCQCHKLKQPSKHHHPPAGSVKGSVCPLLMPLFNCMCGCRRLLVDGCESRGRAEGAFSHEQSSCLHCRQVANTGKELCISDIELLQKKKCLLGRTSCPNYFQDQVELWLMPLETHSEMHLKLCECGGREKDVGDFFFNWDALALDEMNQFWSI